MSHQHSKETQQELWRKVSPPRYQPTSYKQGVPITQPSHPHRQPQSKYTYGIKQLQQARHRSPSYPDPSQLSKLTSQLSQLQLQNSKLQQQNKTLTSSYNRLVDQNRDYRSEIEFFRTQFNKLRTHINSTESVRQEVVKVSKLLEEEKSKTQKYINESNKLSQEIKGLKGVIEGERAGMMAVQKENYEVKRLLEVERKEKEEKMLIINQSRIMFEDEIRVLEEVKGVEERVKELGREIEGQKREIQAVVEEREAGNQEELQMLKMLEEELQTLQSQEEIPTIQSEGVKENDPIIRNLKIIFDEEKGMLVRQLNQKEVRLQQLMNRLESLTIGDDDSIQDVTNI